MKVGDLVKFMKVKGSSELRFAFQVGLITKKGSRLGGYVRVDWLKPKEVGTTYSHFHVDRFKVISCVR